MIIFPPTFRYTTERSLFLAGSIEMGRADPWQEKVSEILSPFYSIIYNPRRPIWDTAWIQSVGSPEFNVQVTWELEMIEKSTHVIVYLQPDTISPITLLELGILSQQKPEKVYVCCPDGYFRKGNVDIVCERYGINLFDSLDKTIEALKWPNYES